MLKRFWHSASGFWAGRAAWGLTVLLVLIVLLQLLVQFLLNLWNRHFFDALERRDAAALWTQAETFVVLAAASIALAAISVWGRMTTQRKWRECLTRQVIDIGSPRIDYRRLDSSRKRLRQSGIPVVGGCSRIVPTRRSISCSPFSPRC